MMVLASEAHSLRNTHSLGVSPSILDWYDYSVSQTRRSVYLIFSGKPYLKILQILVLKLL